jgi:hypothetical protein
MLSIGNAVFVVDERFFKDLFSEIYSKIFIFHFGTAFNAIKINPLTPRLTAILKRISLLNPVRILFV